MTKLGQRMLDSLKKEREHYVRHEIDEIFRAWHERHTSLGIGEISDEAEEKLKEQLVVYVTSARMPPAFEAGES